MAELDLVMRRGVLPIRLAFTSVVPGERRAALGIAGAVQQANDADMITFPPDPWVVSDLRAAVHMLETTARLNRWLEQQRAEAHMSLEIRQQPDTYIPANISWETALYPYQRVGANWLRLVRRGILGDEPGLGKTLQALTAAAAEERLDVNQHQHHRVLISTLASVKSHWADHVENWLNRPAGVATGTRAERKDTVAKTIRDGQWLIINHEMLRTPSDFPELFTTYWDTIILDEAHKFQGRSSAQALGADKLRSTRLFLLTGTPIWSRPDSIWHLLHLLDPIRFSSYWTFVNAYCETAVQPWGTDIIGVRPDKVGRLRNVLAPMLLTRTKAEVLPQLPQKVRVDVTWEPTSYQRKQLRQMRKKLTLDTPVGDFSKMYANVVSAMADMRKLLNSPALLGMPASTSPKDQVIWELLDSLLTETEGRKVIIFTWHKDYAEYLAKLMATSPHNTVCVTGDTPNREEVLQDFRSNPERTLLVATIGSVGTGIDLVEATAAIFAEGAYVPALNAQAEDRLHRIGQTVDVTIYRLMAPQTIESALWRVSDDRADVADQLTSIQALLAAMRAEGSDK